MAVVKEAIPVFTFEADHPRNCDLLLQSIPGQKLRSVIDVTKPAFDYLGKDRERGDAVLSAYQQAWGAYPKTPGMRVTVDTAKLTVDITDPLNEDLETLTKLNKWLTKPRDGGPINSAPVRGDAPKRIQLDVHRIKTLCRELFRLVQMGHGRFVAGIKPSEEDIERLPGKFLLNPGARHQNYQPKFEEDMAAWIDKQTGGN